MSSRRSGGARHVRKPPGRGPSRPVDPRRAPGAPKRTGPDPFAVGLIAVSAVVVLAVVLLALLQNRGTSGTATNPQPQQPPAGQNVTPDMTATAIAFATQSRPEVLPHITVTDAKALYDAENATFIDVRVASQYALGHIAGATNIPYGEVGQRVSEFPRAGNVIVYCQ